MVWPWGVARMVEDQDGKRWEKIGKNGKTMGKAWEKHGKRWETHGKQWGEQMGKVWNSNMPQTCLILYITVSSFRWLLDSRCIKIHPKRNPGNDVLLPNIKAPHLVCHFTSFAGGRPLYQSTSRKNKFMQYLYHPHNPAYPLVI